jgi:long-chain fatty acid transport protein
LEDQIFTTIHLYATQQINEKLFIGFGVGNNFGLGTKWDENWVGRFMAVETEIRTFFFNLTASYEIIPELSVGFGYVFSYGDVLIGKKIRLSQLVASEPYLELEGNGTGSGFTAGVLFKAHKALSIGLSYRSQVSLGFEGDATPKDYPAQFEGQIPNGNISAPLTTPENITIGIALKPLKELTITADYQYVGWDSYDKLEVEFEDFQVNGENYKSASERNYDNSFIARLGAEYKLNPQIDLFGGFLYDKNPIADEKLDPTLPDSDRLGFSLGASYSINNNLAVQAGYLFLRFNERQVTNSEENYSGLTGVQSPFNGVYNSTAHLISLTLAYNL